MAHLKVFNPVARSVEMRVDPAPRPSDLDGKRVGLYWNMKDGGDVALSRVEERLRERFPGARFVRQQGDKGFQYRYLSATGADRMARDCDVVVGTTAD